MKVFFFRVLGLGLIEGFYKALSEFLKSSKRV